MQTRKGKVRQVQTPTVDNELPEQTDDSLLLKAAHTHAGVMYDIGTPVSELNCSDSSLQYMKEHGIV